MPAAAGDAAVVVARAADATDANAQSTAATASRK